VAVFLAARRQEASMNRVSPAARIAWPGPPIDSLVFRHYGGLHELPAMVAVANASDAVDGLAHGRTLESMTRAYAALPNCNPFADVVLAEVDGVLVGYARGWWKREAGGAVMHLQVGVVRPAWRRRGIGGAMLAWLESRQRAIAAQFPADMPQLFNVYVTQGETGRAALLESAGYGVARHFFGMCRPHLRELPDFALPPGLELRPALPQHYEAIWEADRDGLREHWGMADEGAAGYAAWQADADTFQPALWSIAWDPATDRVIGQVRAFVRAAENRQLGRLRGYTEGISVRPAWRRRGVARALIAHSLRLQAAAGTTESGLEVDSANPTGATRTYEACGFVVESHNRVYRKAL
jgi:mycothiol synthase